MSINRGVVSGMGGKTQKAVILAAEHLRALAVDLTPLGETGNLRASATVSMVGENSAAVTYGIVYAARQHEETSWKHPKAGQAKYLEEPAREKQTEIQGVLVQALRGLM